MLIEVIFYLISAFAVAILFKENHKYKQQNSQLRHNLYVCTKKLKDDEKDLNEISKTNIKLERDLEKNAIIKHNDELIQENDKYLKLELEEYKEKVKILTEKTEDMEKYKNIIKQLKNEMEILKVGIKG